MLFILASLALASDGSVPTEIDIGSKPVAPEDQVQVEVPAPAPVPPPEPVVVPKLDCLAGVCIGSKPAKGSTTDTLVTVSNHSWMRTLEVCEGRIVAISIWAGWYQNGFLWGNVISGSTTPVYDEDGSAAVTVRDRVAEAMEANGWVIQDFEAPMAFYASPEVKGIRGVTFERSGDLSANGWYVSVVAVHPDSKQMCASKNAQGL
jgi:hypothetical protein